MQNNCDRPIIIITVECQHRQHGNKDYGTKEINDNMIGLNKEKRK